MHTLLITITMILFITVFIVCLYDISIYHLTQFVRKYQKHTKSHIHPQTPQIITSPQLYRQSNIFSIAKDSTHLQSSYAPFISYNIYYQSYLVKHHIMEPGNPRFQAYYLQQAQMQIVELEHRLREKDKDFRRLQQFVRIMEDQQKQYRRQIEHHLDHSYEEENDRAKPTRDNYEQMTQKDQRRNHQHIKQEYQLDQLEATVQALTHQLADRQEQLEEVRHQYIRLKDGISLEAEQIEQLKEENNELKLELERMEKEQKQNHINNLWWKEFIRQNVQNQIQEGGQRKNLKEYILMEQMEKLKCDMEVLEEEKRLLSVENRHQQERIQHLMRQVEKRMYEGGQLQNKELEYQLKEKDEQVDELTEYLKEKLTELDNTKRSLNILKNDLQAEHSQKMSLQNSCNHLKSHLSELTANQTQTRDQMNKKLLLLADKLAQICGQLQNQKLTHKSQKYFFQTKISQLLQKQNWFKEELQKKEIMIQQYQKMNKDREDDLGVKEEMKMLEEKFVMIMEENASLNSLIQRMAVQRQELLKQLDSLNKQKCSLKNEMEQFKKDQLRMMSQEAALMQQLRKDHENDIAEIKQEARDLLQLTKGTVEKMAALLAEPQNAPVTSQTASQQTEPDSTMTFQVLQVLQQQEPSDRPCKHFARQAELKKMVEQYLSQVVGLTSRLS